MVNSNEILIEVQADAWQTSHFAWLTIFLLRVFDDTLW